MATATATANNANNANSPQAVDGAKTILGWVLLLVIVAAFTRTRLGYVAIYYSLVLSIVLLLLGSYPRVVDLLGSVRAPDGPAGG